MKLFVFTKEDDPIMRDAMEIGNELKNEGLEVQNLDIDDIDGQQKASLYDIYTCPSFLVVRDDGSIVQLWQGNIPPKGELANLLRS